MRELAMRPVSVLMGLEHRQDRRLLRGSDCVHRMPARRPVLQRPGQPAFAPAPRAALGELEISADAAVIRAVRDRPVDQLKQPVLGGRRHAQRDPATQPQRPFPSASINLTPISLTKAVSSRNHGETTAARASAPRARGCARRSAFRTMKSRRASRSGSACRSPPRRSSRPPPRVRPARRDRRRRLEIERWRRLTVQPWVATGHPSPRTPSVAEEDRVTRAGDGRFNSTPGALSDETGPLCQRWIVGQRQLRVPANFH